MFTHSDLYLSHNTFQSSENNFTDGFCKQEQMSKCTKAEEYSAQSVILDQSVLSESLREILKKDVMIYTLRNDVIIYTKMSGARQIVLSVYRKM